MKKTIIILIFGILLLLFAGGAIYNSRLRPLSNDGNNINAVMGKKDTTKDLRVIKTPELFDFQVVFDQSNEQVYSPFDTSFTGMSKLAIQIRRKGGFVSINSRPLNEFLPEFNHGKRILVLGVAMFRSYSENDIAAVMNYLEEGGDILLFVEHDDLMKNGTLQNQILEKIGVEALPISSSTKDREQKHPHWPYCSVEPWQLTKVQPFLPAPLIIHEKSQAKSIMKIIDPVEEKLEVVAVVDSSKRGMFFVLGDAELVWNGTDILGIDAGENVQFMDSVIDMLFQHNYKAMDDFSPINITDLYKTKFGKKVLFENSGMGVIPGGYGGFNVLAQKFAKMGFNVDIGGGVETDYANYELVIVAQPLMELPEPQKILAAKKVLIIADGQADYLETKEISDILTRMSGKEIDRSEYVLNSLTEGLGFRFVSTTIVTDNIINEGGTHFVVGAEWDNGEKWILNRSSAIAPISTEFSADIKVLAKSQVGSWESNNITPRQKLKKNPVMPFQPPLEVSKKMGLPVVISSNKFFAVADIELLVDDFANSTESEYLLGRIKQWMSE